MPDSRKHRGKHPNDVKIFSDKYIADIRSAVHDFSLLLSMGYPERSSLKLVGDKFRLNERQRLAVLRSSCSDQSLQYRKDHEKPPENHRHILIDGYNFLITLESALSGGILFKGRDGCYRDLSGIHGSYKKVEETIPALKLAAQVQQELNIQKLDWYFDAPVSNSGRLKTLIYELSAEHNWPWDVYLENNPDNILKASKVPVVTHDSTILDECSSWVNLGKYIIDSKTHNAHVIDLTKEETGKR